MEPILEKLYTAFQAKLGPAASLVPMAADRVRIAIKAGDAAQALAVFNELDEAADAVKELAAKGRAALAPDADGVSRLSGLESAELAVALEHLADEAEDVAKGHDEDDGGPEVPPPAVTKPAKPTS